jgi:hypothetical protein
MGTFFQSLLNRTFPMPNNNVTPAQLSDLYNDFFMQGEVSDATYVDGLIVQTNRGHMATLYARNSCGRDGVTSRKLSQVVGQWATEPMTPFHYSIRPLPQGVIEKLSGTPYKNDDRLLMIMGMDLKALTEEVYHAKKVLSALGLRAIGPANPDDEKLYQVATQSLVSVVRKTAEESSTEASTGISHPGLPLAAKASVKRSHGREWRDEADFTIGTEDDLPVGATREWLFLKAIGIAAGVPGQPATMLNLYRDAHDQKDSSVLKGAFWSVSEKTGACGHRGDRVNDVLKDAEAVRTFLDDKLSDMRHRFSSMAKGCMGWSTDQFRHVSDTADRDKKDRELFSDIENAIASIQIQAKHSLAADGGQDDSLFNRLKGLGDACDAMGGIAWASRDFTTLAYTAELLTIIERGALFFQKETVRRIQDGISSLPDDILAALRGKEIKIQPGYDQRIEGNLVKPGLLPAGFAGEFPCVEQEEGSVVLVAVADIGNFPEKGSFMLLVPKVPEIAHWLMTDAEKAQAKDNHATESCAQPPKGLFVDGGVIFAGMEEEATDASTIALRSLSVNDTADAR